MTTSTFLNGRSQSVRIPKELRLPPGRVSIRRLGHGVFLEPLGGETWPKDYFRKITVTDRSFRRPNPGSLPAAPRLA